MENINAEAIYLDVLTDLINLKELQYDFPASDLDSDEPSPTSCSDSTTDCFTFPVEVKSEATDVLTSCKESKRRPVGRKEINPVDAYKIKRNIRERRRTKRIADGFLKLQNAIPHCRGRKRLSKIDTLRNALAYIYYLSDILYEDDMKRNALKAEQMLRSQIPNAQRGHILAQNSPVLPISSRPIFLYPAVGNQPSF